ncbi:MAG: hypothetical protein NTZ18_04780 [Candidatus Komeilibacteria bacterium]|nr:hypothetical protein [Candidatus Komeilibacteria bacterium]
MKEISKVFYHLYLVIIGILALIVLISGALWLVSGQIARGHQRQIAAVLPLFKQAVEVKPEDSIRACVYSDNLTVISLNSRYYFTVKNNQVKLMEIMHLREPKIYPTLVKDQEFADLYWVLENCR